MSTANKLTYLNETKQKIKEAINSSEIVEITDQPFREYADKITTMQDKYKKYLSKIVVDKEGNDNILELKSALDYNVLGLDIYGNSEQVQTTGKQLFNANREYPFTYKGITFTKNSDGSVTLNGTFEGSSNENVRLSDFIPVIQQEKMNGQNIAMKVTMTEHDYSFSIGIKRSGANRVVIDLPNGAGTYTKISKYTMQDGDTDNNIAFVVYIHSGDVFNNLTIHPMFIIGDEPLDYEPYTRGEPSPSPEYPQEVKCVEGIENIFDNETIFKNFTKNSEGYYEITSSADLSSLYGQSASGFPVKFENGNQYTFSYKIHADKDTTNPSAVFTIMYSDGMATKISTQEKAVDEITFTSTKGKNISMLYFTYNDSAKLYIKDFQIEKGTIAHEYVPYGRYLPINVSGKNLLPNYRDKSQTYEGITYEINKDGSINVRGSAAAYSRLIDTNTFKLKKGTYYLYSSFKEVNGVYAQLRYSDGTSIIATNHYTKFIINEDSDVIFRIYVVNGTQNVNTIVYPMITANEVKDYQPYYSKDYYYPLKKKNLFDKNSANILDVYVSAADTAVMSSQSSHSIYILCKPNTNYYIKKISSTRFRIADTNKFPNAGTPVGNRKEDNTADHISFKTSTSANYLVLTYYNSATDSLPEQEILNSITIYKGISSDDYYELCKIGDAKDEFDVVSGKLTKRIENYVFSGDENGAKYNDVFYLYLTLDYKKTKEVTTICNKYKSVANISGGGELTENDTIALFLSESSNRVYIRDNRFSLLTELKEYLKEQYDAGTPVTIYYELVEPEEYQLDTKLVIPLNAGYNKTTLIDDVKTTLEGEYIANGNELIKEDNTSSNVAKMLPNEEPNLIIPSIDKMPIEEEVEVVGNIDTLPAKEQTKINRDLWY